MDILRHTGPRAAVVVRRRRGGQPRDGPHAVGDRALHRGGPPAQIDLAPRGLRRRSAASSSDDLDELRRRHQRLHRRGAARPDEAARRVRRVRQDAGDVEGHRRDRHGLADRRHLRQGRRQRGALARCCSRRSQKRFGTTRGPRARGRDFRSKNDPEAPTTVLGKRFPYQTRVAVLASAASRCPTRARSSSTPVGAAARRRARARDARRSARQLDARARRAPRTPPTGSWSARASRRPATRSACSARRSATTCRRS